jgi:pyruvate/2-oxoglutarate dehydrogenase complex dihydrolipoamide dehydrogenase (E3) component
VSIVRKHSWDFDVAIVGGGSAGYAAARTVSGFGLKAVVIEGGEKVGGLCILRGCMPTKALLYAAEVKHLAGIAMAWGVKTGKVGVNFRKVMARKNAVIEDFADYRRKQLNEGKFRFIRATARFVDGHTLELNPGGRLTAASIVISTGSVVSPSPLKELDKVGYLTSDTALELDRLPRSLIVLGGGAVGMEFAQCFSRFGVNVSLVQRSPHVLRCFDFDATEVIEKVFQREGIEVYTGTKLLGARRAGRAKEVMFKQGGKIKRVQGEEILFALGRKPNTDSLGLERAGVRLNSGLIEVDAGMRTSVPHIYAAGDCLGMDEIVHIAVQQGEIVGNNIAQPHRLRETDSRLLIEIVFTEPQLGFVGLTERKARAAGIPYIAAKYTFDDHGKSLIMEAKDGFVKLLANPKSGEIIGGACAGPVGGELLHEVVVAMSKRMTVHELAATPHYHPTLAEIWTYPAEELAAMIKMPSKRRIKVQEHY